MNGFTRLMRVIAVASVVFSTVPGFTQSADETGDPAMARLQALGTMLRTRSVWTAPYTQEYIPPGMTLGEIVEGRVWLSWPDKALFSTGDPIQRWMGMEGRLIRLLDLENSTCDDHRLTNGEWERIPLIAVLDPSGALERFSVVSEGENGLALIPRDPGGVSRVEISISEAGLPDRVVIRDPQGAVSTFEFGSWNGVDSPPDGDWLPRPPEGISCVGGTDEFSIGEPS